MDRSWINKSRCSTDYIIGLNNYLRRRLTSNGVDGQIICPCRKCRNAKWATLEDAQVHLICDGFMRGYEQWVLHEESSLSVSPIIHGEPSSIFEDDRAIGEDTQTLLHEAFGVRDTAMGEDITDISGENQPNEEAQTFYKLLKDAEQEIYPGCTKFSKLSFIVRLFHLKCMNKWSDKSVSDLLKFLKEVLPTGEKLPNSFYEAKKLVGDLGLNYRKIHACPNDCKLYWKEYEHDVDCHICGESRYERDKNGSDEESQSSNKVKQIPAKVLWHFPLIPRLQRLFMSSKTASFMRWHKDDRTKDGYMRHPADSPAWQTFDYRNEQFAKDPRNVRLGLACDGFNPFKSLSISHSTWPVILIPYNLPPWMCMKQQFFMLSLLIPGPTAPGNNIDVYLQPLIEELKELWHDGINTYDASTRENFKMYAAVLWTVSDFPAYANLSGWSTKGEFACPSCHKYTRSKWLKHSKKHCYMGHRRFLNRDNALRRDQRSFDGVEEYDEAPPRLTGDMVLDELNGFEHTFGKLVSNNPELPFNWKKQSIFFELPYWKDNLIRHNLDVMHIEKNVCDNVIGTLLNLEGKSKDHIKARRDLQDLGIRPELHPFEDASGRTYLPPACFSMDRAEKDLFCRLLQNVKVPDGYAANISRCVNLKPHKLSGLKSHDNHILMQQLLPLALRLVLPRQVQATLIGLCNFFKELCGKVLHARDLIRLEGHITKTLCQMEKIFPPTFFDIMIHLPIHLAHEARIAGPVQYRWMYPIERYLSTLKSYVRNRSRVEGSIAEGYLAEECMIFCSRYLEDVQSKFNQVSRNYDVGASVETQLSIFRMPGRPFLKEKIVTFNSETLKKAHQYVLFNCAEVDPFIKEHHSLIVGENSRARRRDLERTHTNTFASWFSNQVQDSHLMEQRNISEELKALARGPYMVGKRYKGFIVNGFRFQIKKLEKKRKTQNSGVFVTAKTTSFSSASDNNPTTGDVTYYGILKDIIELHYFANKKVVESEVVELRQEMGEMKSLVRQLINKGSNSSEPSQNPSSSHSLTPSLDDTPSLTPSLDDTPSMPSFEHRPSTSGSEHRPLARDVEHRSPTPNSECQPVREGSFVVLKSIISGVQIAKGIIQKIDPSWRVGGETLGSGWCEVLVRIPIKNDERLLRSYDLIKTIGDAIGVPIAWPIPFVEEDDDF